jgi:ribonuclease HI
MDGRNFIRFRGCLLPKHEKSVTMTVPAPHFTAPHYLLFSEANSHDEPDASEAGSWHFVLESVDGTSKVEATDEESEVDTQRLELLAVVRGLEALNQPSQVTLVTRSRSVSRGFRFGMDRWRENEWQWECFGKMTPIKDADLWQRVDHAMQYHDVRCRTWRFDPPETTVPAPKFATRERKAKDSRRVRRVNRFAAISNRVSACLGALRPQAGR